MLILAICMKSQVKNRPIPDRHGGGRRFTTPGGEESSNGEVSNTEKGNQKWGEEAPVLGIIQATISAKTSATTSDQSASSHSENPAPSTAQRFKIEFAADEQFVSKLEQIRSRLSGRFPKGVSLEKLFALLIDEHLEKNDQARRAEKRKGRAPALPGKGPRSGESRNAAGEGKTQSAEARPRRGDQQEEQAHQPRQTRHIPAAIRDQVDLRDGGQCTWITPDGTRCESTWDLEIDHIQPFALGGEHLPDNLRLLCACHNRLEGEIRFGSSQ